MRESTQSEWRWAEEHGQPVDRPNRYVRTLGGEVVHRADCELLKTRWLDDQSEWRWAEGKTPAEIAAEAAALRVYFVWCTTCFPGGHP